MKSVNVMALCMIVSVISFLGFVVENVWLCMTKGYIDNRNMCFPFLLGYGIAILLIYIILGTPKKVWFFGKVIQIQNRVIRGLVYFVGVMICVSVGEILLGTFVEKACGFYWWDYSNLPMHITRYTTIPTSAMFSLLIVIFMELCFAPLYHFFVKWNYHILRGTALVLSVIMMGDFVYNAYKMYKLRGMIRRWRMDTKRSRLYKKLHA